MARQYGTIRSTLNPPELRVRPGLGLFDTSSAKGADDIDDDSEEDDAEAALSMFDPLPGSGIVDELKTCLQIVNDNDAHARIATTKLNEQIALHEIFTKMLSTLSFALDDHECPPFKATLREEITNELGGNLVWDEDFYKEL